MERLVDINCNPFARGHDFVDFIEVEEAERIAAAFSPELPDGCAATLQLTPPLYYCLADGIAATRRINDALLANAARIGGLAAGVVEPKFGDAALAEIERIGSLGARAIVWSARAQGVFINDRLMAELCRFAFAQGLVPMIHSAPFSVNESLERVWSLARQCEDVPMVVAGALASWENVQAICDALRRRRRVRTGAAQGSAPGLRATGTDGPGPSTPSTRPCTACTALTRACQRSAASCRARRARASLCNA